MRPALIVVMLSFLALTSQKGLAQELTDENRQQARVLVDQGLRLFGEKNYAQAVQFLERAYVRYPSAKIQYSLGRVYEAQRSWLKAMRAYQRFLSEVAEPGRSPQQGDDAKAAVRRIAPFLGQVRVQGPAGSRYQLDGGPEQQISSQADWVDPGVHRITGPGDERTITIQAGELAVATLELPAVVQQRMPPEPTTATSQPEADDDESVGQSASGQVPKAAQGQPKREVAKTSPPRRRRSLRAAKWTLGVLGILTTATGAILWALDGQQTCSRTLPGEQCPQMLSTRTLGIGVLAGGLALVATSGLFFGLDARGSDSAVQASALALAGRF